MNIRYLAAALAAAGLCLAQPSPTGANDIALAGPGYRVPTPALEAAPGQVVVLHVQGIKTTIDQNLAAVPGPSGFPHSLNGISVDLIQGRPNTVISLELRAAYQIHCIEPCAAVTGITLQIPFELEADFNAKGDPNPWLRISENGAQVGGISLIPVTDNVHVLNTCDDTQTYVSAAYSVPQNICAHVVMGNNALNSLYNLAHGGDELAVWLYGMGARTADTPNCCTTPDQFSHPIQPFMLNFDFRPNAPRISRSRGLRPHRCTPVRRLCGRRNVPDQPGRATGPAGLPACDGVRIKSNLTITITGPHSSDAAQICVLP